MTKTSQIAELKKLAKRYARATRLPQHKALDYIATQLGFSNWRALQLRVKSGWLPTEEAIAGVRQNVSEENPLANDPERSFGEFNFFASDHDESKSGTIGGHSYNLFILHDDVHIEGEGWHILVPEAPNAAPIVEIDERYHKNCPVNEPAFLQAALEIATIESVKVQARISSDWSRRSTKPDAKGVVRHPLFNEIDGSRKESNVWYCLHCNAKISGEQIAKNLWHCPACAASPLDIYNTPFWLESNDEAPKPISSPVQVGRGEPIIKLVDISLKFELDAGKIELLIRSALFDDATNAGEQLGAVLAEISVDSENDVWISFESNYWPEEKEPTQALAVAETLGIEVHQELMLVPPPFACPEIAEYASSTLEYTKLMLRAYEEHMSPNDET